MTERILDANNQRLFWNFRYGWEILTFFVTISITFVGLYAGTTLPFFIIAYFISKKLKFTMDYGKINAVHIANTKDEFSWIFVIASGVILMSQFEIVSEYMLNIIEPSEIRKTDVVDWVWGIACAPIIEEFTFRFFLYHFWTRLNLSDRFIMHTSSIAFSILHLNNFPFQDNLYWSGDYYFIQSIVFIRHYIGGLLLYKIFRKTNLKTAIWAHAFNNFTVYSLAEII